MPSVGPIFPAVCSYPRAVAEVGLRLANALGYLHGLGVAHGDLKPSNVVLGPGGHPYLIDFNLSGDFDCSSRTAGGTLPYMAPEILDVLAGGIDPGHDRARADLYSFGVMLFEMLCGRLPHQPLRAEPAAAAADLLDHIKSVPPDLRGLAPPVPRRLARLVEKCLAPTPENRPRDAQEIVRELRKVAGTRGRSQTRSLLFAVAVITLGVFLGSMYGSQSAGLPPEPKSEEEYFTRGLTYLRGGQLSPALSDFDRARVGGNDDRVDAYRAYCLALMRQHEPAIGLGQNLVNRGVVSPRVMNNLAYSLAQYGRSSDAEAVLDKVLRIDPGLRAARYNRAMTKLLAPQVGKTGLDDRSAADDIKAALSSGPPTGALYHDAARVYAASAELDGAFPREAIRCLKEAVNRGRSPTRFNQDPVLSRYLGKMHDFQVVCNMTAGDPEIAPPNLRVVEPKDVTSHPR